MSLALQPQAPKAGTAPAAPAHEAQPSGTPSSTNQPPPSMGFFGSPLFLMLLFLPFIFMMWRRNKKETEARAKLKKGDKVVAGGLIGEIVDLDERVAKLKIAPGVTVQALASALQAMEEPQKTPDTSPASKDAKAKTAKS